jgi:hypothetical protein
MTFVVVTIGIVGMAALLVEPWIGIPLLLAAVAVALTGVFWNGAHAEATTPEDDVTLMSHMRGPGI